MGRSLLADAETGRNWLRSLQEVEPPAGLVINILVATSGFQTGRSGVLNPSRTSWWEQFTTAFIRAGTARGIRQPRFVMSFGMAFFSVSICLSLAGIKLSDLRTPDLRPSAIKRNYYETSGRVVKYYENIRFVYEFESRVREFKRITEPAEPRREQEEDKNKERRNDTSGQPDQKEDRDYSQGEGSPMLAELPTSRAATTSGRAL